MPDAQSKEIARGIVAIYKDYLGRGPEGVKTTIGDDHVVTVLEGSLTRAEASLVEQGDEESVREIRRKFQVAMAEDITQLVERVTGRPAKAMLSDHNVEKDVAVEMVMFGEAA